MKMYRCEKFLPPECPRCRKAFQQEGRDYIRLLGDIVEGEKHIRETNGYSILICELCNNYCIKIDLEFYQLSDESGIDNLVKNHGFVNKIEVETVGDAYWNGHYTYQAIPDVQVEAVKCDSN